jgi:hypothetical protein
MRGHGDKQVERDAMRRRSGEDHVVRQFDGRKGAGPVDGWSSFRGRGGAHDRVGRGSRSL